MMNPLKEIIEQSHHLVFFGGAGVSTESGIPDFRSADGLYHQTYDYPPETILSHSFYLSHREAFFQFYRDKMLVLDVQPNMAHKKLAMLEQNGILKAVITQNIDGLHQLAGSKTVLELHGSIHRNYCQTCGKCYDASFMLHSPSIPHCSCGGDIKPDVILYEESLHEDILTSAIHQLESADTLIVGGTSLSVYPAAGLIRYFHGNHLILINQTPTPYDHHADLVIHGRIGEIFAGL